MHSSPPVPLSPTKSPMTRSQSAADVRPINRDGCGNEKPSVNRTAIRLPSPPKNRKRAPSCPVVRNRDASVMEIINASEAREKLYRLLDHTAAGHKPVLIIGPRSNAVLIVVEYW